MPYGRMVAEQSTIWYKEKTTDKMNDKKKAECEIDGYVSLMWDEKSFEKKV